MSESRILFVGIDWASRCHQVAVADDFGNLLEEREVAHDAAELLSLCDGLVARSGGDPAKVRVAIERPDGLVVDTLLERGFRVFALNPKQFDRFRDRMSPSGAKDDRRDARVLASALRTDEPAFRQVDPDSPEIVVLRELSREHDDLTRKRVRVENQARELLNRYYPQFLKLGALRLWSIAVWRLLPSPEAVTKRNVSRSLVRVVKQFRLRRHSAASILETLRAEPCFRAGRGVAQACQMRLGRALRELELLSQQLLENRKATEQQLQLLADAGSSGSSDVELLSSFPGVGVVVLSTLLSEGGRSLQKGDYHSLRALAGVAPVTRRSGRAHCVCQRQACNRRLREAVYHLARIMAQVHEPTTRRYADLRARGHSNGRTLRGIGDKALRILCAMIRDRSHFRPPVAA